MFRTQLEQVLKTPVSAEAVAVEVENEVSRTSEDVLDKLSIEVDEYGKVNLSPLFHMNFEQNDAYDTTMHLNQFSQKVQNIEKLLHIESNLSSFPQNLSDEILGQFDPVLLERKERLLDQWERETELQSDLILEILHIDSYMSFSLLEELFNSLEIIHLSHEGEITRRSVFEKSEIINEVSDHDYLHDLSVQFEIDCDYNEDENMFCEKVESKVEMIVERLPFKLKGEVPPDYEPVEGQHDDLYKRELASEMALQGRYNQLYVASSMINDNGVELVNLDQFCTRYSSEAENTGQSVEIENIAERVDEGIKFVFESNLEQENFMDLLDHCNKNNFLFSSTPGVDFYQEIKQENIIFCPFKKLNKYGEFQFELLEKNIDFIEQKIIEGPNIRIQNMFQTNVESIEDSNLFLEFIFVTYISEAECHDISFLERQCRLRENNNLGYCTELLSLTKLMMIYQDMEENLNHIFYYFERMRCDLLNIPFNYGLDSEKSKFILDQNENEIIFEEVFDEIIFIEKELLEQFLQQKTEKSGQSYPQIIVELFMKENNRLINVKELCESLFNIFYRSTEYHHSLLFLVLIFIRERCLDNLVLIELKDFLNELILSEEKDEKNLVKKLKELDKSEVFKDYEDSIEIDHSVGIQIIFELFSTSSYFNQKYPDLLFFDSLIASYRLELMFVSKLRSLQSGEDIIIENLFDFNQKMFSNILSFQNSEMLRQSLFLEKFVYSITEKLFILEELFCVNFVIKESRLEFDEKEMTKMMNPDELLLLEKLISFNPNENNKINFTEVDCFKEYGSPDFIETFDEFSYQICNNISVNFVFDLIEGINSALEISFDDVSEINGLLKIVDKYLKTIGNYVYAKLEYYDLLVFTDVTKINYQSELKCLESIKRNSDHLKELEQVYENFIPLTQKAFLTQQHEKDEQNHVPELIIEEIHLLAEYQVLWKKSSYGKLRQEFLPKIQLIEEREEGSYDKLVEPEYLEFGMDSYEEIFSLAQQSDLFNHITSITAQFYQRVQLLKKIFCINKYNYDYGIDIVEEVKENEKLKEFSSGSLFENDNGEFTIPSLEAIHEISFASVQPSTLILSTAFDWYNVILNIYKFAGTIVRNEIINSVVELSVIQADFLENLNAIYSNNETILKKSISNEIVANEIVCKEKTLYLLNLIKNNEDISINLALSEKLIMEYILKEIYMIQTYLAESNQRFKINDLSNINCLVYKQIFELFESNFLLQIKRKDCYMLFDSFENNEFAFHLYKYYPQSEDHNSLVGWLQELEEKYKNLYAFGFDFALNNQPIIEAVPYELYNEKENFEQELYLLSQELMKHDVSQSRENKLQYQDIFIICYRYFVKRNLELNNEIFEYQKSLYCRILNKNYDYRSDASCFIKSELLILKLDQFENNTENKINFDFQQFVYDRKFDYPISYETIIPGCFGSVDLEKIKELEENQLEKGNFAFMNILPLRLLYEEIIRESSRTDTQDIALISPYSLALSLEEFAANVYHYINEQIFSIQNIDSYENQYETSEYSQAEIGLRSIDYELVCYYELYKMQLEEIELSKKLNFEENTEETFINLINNRTVQNIENFYSKLLLITTNIEQYIPEAADIFRIMLQNLYENSLHSLKMTLVMIEHENIESKEDFLENVSAALLNKKLSALERLFKSSGQQIFNEIYHYEVELEKLERNLLIEARLLRRSVGFEHLRLSELEEEISNITNLEESEETRLNILNSSLSNTNLEKSNKMRESLTTLTAELSGISQELGLLKEQLKSVVPEREKPIKELSEPHLEPLSALADVIATPNKLEIDSVYVGSKLRQVEEDCIIREEQVNQVKKERDAICVRNEQEIQILQERFQISHDRRLEAVRSVNRIEQAQEMAEEAKIKKLKVFDLQLEDELSILEEELNRERVAERNLEKKLNDMKQLIIDFERETSKRLKNLFI